MRLRDAVARCGCEMRLEARDASCDCQMSRVEEFSGVCLWLIHSMEYLCNSFLLSGIDLIFGMVLL